MNTRHRAAVAGVPAASAGAHQAGTGIRQTSSHDPTAGEALAGKDTLAYASFRVAGKVRPGSVRYMTKAPQVDLAIAAPDHPGGSPS